MTGFVRPSQEENVLDYRIVAFAPAAEPGWRVVDLGHAFPIVGWLTIDELSRTVGDQRRVVAASVDDRGYVVPVFDEFHVECVLSPRDSLAPGGRV